MVLTATDLSAPLGAPQTLRLLLAADESAQESRIAAALRAAGYELDIASDGAAALAMLATRPYDLLLTDWDRSVRDGTQLCREVRRTDLSGSIYILAFTGPETSADVVAGLDPGADDTLRREAEPNELLGRIRLASRLIRADQAWQAARRRIERIAITDPVLPLYNRRYLDEMLPREVDRARRYGRALSVVLCDLDHFSFVNDTYGHEAGNEVLLAFAGLLNSTLRTSDWAARCGGDEFAIVLPETPADRALILADRLRSTLCAGKLPISGGELAITASYGIASARRLIERTPAITLRLLQEAEEALRESKHSGRNCASLSLAEDAPLSARSAP